MENFQMLDNKSVDFNKFLNICAIRCTKLLALAIKVKNKNTRIKFSGFEWSSPICDTTLEGISRQVLDILLPYIPQYFDFDYNRLSFENLEKACTEIIKLAAIEAFKNIPDDFWDMFESYLGKGVHLYNEIILSILRHLPKRSSDQIISYLYSDFNKTLFERTSNNKNELFLAKEVIKVHSKHCTKTVFSQLENAICSYISPDANYKLQSRISYNNDLVNKDTRAYWSFWGGLQYELLNVLPCERLNQYASELLRVLKRKCNDNLTEHDYYGGHGGGVYSPVSGKDLSNKQWLRIIFNKKILSRDDYKSNRLMSVEVPGGFIESNLEQFSSTFQSVVTKNPERMIKLLLAQTRKIPKNYASSLLSGVAYSEKIKNIPPKLLEEMIVNIWRSHASNIASAICSILGKRSDEVWSQPIIDILVEIATNNDEFNEAWGNNADDFSSIEFASWNITKGKAATTISNLLWKHKNLFRQFKGAIEKLTKDENPAIKLASLDSLYASYNYDNNWVLVKCLELFESDFRLIGFRESRWFLFKIYHQYPEYKVRIFSLIETCYNSGDESLAKQGAYWMAEAFISYDEFTNFLDDVNRMSKIQAEPVLDMASAYIKNGEHINISKNIFALFFNSVLDLEHSFSRLFFDKRLDLERDKDFIISLMQSKFGLKMTYQFVNYVLDKSASLFSYHDIILTISESLLNNANIEKREWSLEHDLPNLIAKLYGLLLIMMMLHIHFYP